MSRETKKALPRNASHTYSFPFSPHTYYKSAVLPIELYRRKKCCATTGFWNRNTDWVGVERMITTYYRVPNQYVSLLTVLILTQPFENVKWFFYFFKKYFFYVVSAGVNPVLLISSLLLAYVMFAFAYLTNDFSKRWRDTYLISFLKAVASRR